jgi:hypothetical protein
MYSRMPEVIERTAPLAVIPENRTTSVVLERYVRHLSHIPRDLNVSWGIGGTAEIREYEFGVGRRGRKKAFTLRFTDYPGGYLRQEEEHAEHALLQCALDRADIVLIGVDTPAALVEGGKYHEEMNIPRLVADEVERMLQKDTSRLIILVPLKCEYWVTSARGGQYVPSARNGEYVTERIEGKYRDLLDCIRSTEIRRRVGCVITPVQTIGSVRYSHLEEGPGGPVFHFRRTGTEPYYRPVDIDQPLRWALRFMINKYRIDLRNLTTTGRQQINQTDAAFIDGLERFYSHSKSGGGFKVLQDHRFLRRTR